MQCTCEKVKEMLSLYIDNELCDSEKNAIKTHLETCDECKGEYEFLHSIVSAANTMPMLSVSADLHAKIMQEATNQPVKKPARRSIWRITSAFAAAAAVVAISVISFGSLPGHPELTETPETVIQTPAQVEQTPTTPAKAPTTEQTEPASKPTSPTPQKPLSEPQTPAIASQEEPVVPAALEEPAMALSDGAETFEGDGTETQPAAYGRTVEPVTCYYIGEESYEAAVLILDGYEFDGIAYLIPSVEKDVVYEKLQALPGFVRYTEEGASEETIRIALACE